jgi:hypothetical protein
MAANQELTDLTSAFFVASSSSLNCRDRVNAEPSQDEIARALTTLACAGGIRVRQIA